MKIRPIKIQIASALVVLLLSVNISRAELLTSAGIHAFPDSKVVVSITGTELSEMDFKMTFDIPTFKAEVGTGKGSPMKVAPNGWAAQFVSPNQLWIFDGLGKVTLFERTIDPRGFKQSDSSVVPSLLTKAPEELRFLMAKTGSADKTAPNK